MTAPVLTPVQRQSLKGIAHSLNPVVIIGDAGLTANVRKEVDRALTAHELIKVRVAGDDREARIEIATSLCDTLGAALVQHIGKLLVLFRPAPERLIPAPRPAAKTAGKTALSPAKARTPAAPRGALAPPRRMAASGGEEAARPAARPAGRTTAGGAARPAAKTSARVNPISGRTAAAPRNGRAATAAAAAAGPRPRPNRAQRVKASGQKSTKKPFQAR